MAEPYSTSPAPEGQQAERDAETARLLAERNPDGLQRLLTDHGGRVRWTLRRDFNNMLDLSEIDDALSQAAHRAWRSNQAFDLERGTLRAWFYVISRNCALRILEAKRASGSLRYVDDLDSVSALTGAPLPESSAERRQLVCVLHRCIDRLPAQQRAVILADLAAGGVASTEHLVQQLETTANAVYVARANARKALRAALHAAGHPAAEPKRDSRRRMMS